MIGPESMPNVLPKVEDNERNIVLLRTGGTVARKRGDAVEEDIGETRGRNLAVQFFATRRTELFLRSIRGFQDAVGVEQAALSGPIGWSFR